MLYDLIRPALFALDPETVHDVTIKTLALWQRTPFVPAPAVSDKPIRVMGLDFPNRVGLAAGLDKNGACIDALAGMGFGSIEIGTVTPRPQPGNPKPRMFRLEAQRGIINRLGFNNGGLSALINNVRASRFTGILGINIGKNADTPIERAVDDYVLGLAGVYELASYVTINISSPNTKNLRQLQGENELDELLGTLKRTQLELADHHGRYVPMALKIAPDLDTEQLRHISETLVKHKIDAVIATNTTLSRDTVQGSPHAAEAGGLSGAPVFARSTEVVFQLAQLLQGAVPIIGVGGILSGEDAKSKLEAGASLVQIYSGLIYRGPALVREAVAATQDFAGAIL